jgi:pimeloyl-ACP methyl ester carboxylesterase
MRAMMQAVFYDTTWLSEDALRKIFADKLATHDGYTIRSLLGNPALGSERMDNRLANIKVPTLVLWGKQDTLLPIAAGERYTEGISGARMVSFDKCGHVPAMEKTEEFLSAVNGFLGSGTTAAH